MQTICLVNGSLRGEKASSLKFLRDVDRLLGDDEYRKHFITVKARFRGSHPEAVLGAMRDADALVFVFPLFGYSLPGALTRLKTFLLAMRDWMERRSRRRRDRARA